MVEAARATASLILVSCIACAAACGGRSSLLAIDDGNLAGTPTTGGANTVGSGSGGAGSGGAGSGGAGMGGQATTLCTPTEEPVALAVGQMGPQRVVVDETHAYWTDHNTGSGRIMRADIEQGGAEVVAPGMSRPRAIAIDASHVYWADVHAGTVERFEKAGGTIESLGPWQHNPTAMSVGNGGVYWANRSSGQGGQIMFWSEDNDAPIEIAAGQPQSFLVAVDDRAVWWLNGSSVEGSLIARGIDGGPLAFWSSIDTPRTLTVDDQRVYIGDAGSLLATFKDSGPITTLVEDAVTRGTASDGVNVYWTDAQGNVGRIPVGGGDITWLAELPRARGITIDDRCVYVAVGSSGQNTDNGAVFKLRK